MTPAGLPRRLAAMTYDALLLVAILMIGTGLFLPFTGGEAVTSDTHPVLVVFYRLAMLGLVCGFFGIFWTRRGQTLGMQSWRIRVERNDGSLLSWRDSLLRLAAAMLSLLPLGLGFLWILFDAERRAWHDRLTKTQVVLLPKPDKP